MKTHRQKLEATIPWKRLDHDHEDFYGDHCPASTEIGLVSIRVEDDTGFPELTIVAVGEANLDRFLTEYEWGWPQPVDLFLHWKSKAERQSPPARPQIPAFNKIKKSELLENRRTA